jgi:lipoprotein-releasing system permease protein
MLGVGVGVMALVIVLSVFNGLEDLNRQIFKTHDADLKISIKEGKSFELDKAKLLKIKELSDVSYITEVIQDNALARYRDANMVITLKGVDSTFQQHSKIKESLVEGKFELSENRTNGSANNKIHAFAFIGGGVYAALSINLEDPFQRLDLLYPRNQKTDLLNPDENINSLSINVSGVFSLEQQYDDVVYVPLAVARDLTEYKNRRTSLEIFLKNEKNLEKVHNELKKIYGEKFLVQTSDEQNASLFRAIKIEKLFIFVALLFIIGVASFNIFFSLTMLAIDKQDDVKTLLAMGAENSLIKRIFYNEGAIIAFSGASVGLILGAIICFVQERFGIVSMGMKSAIVDAYPVKMQLSDFIFTAIAIIIITLLASYLPAKRAVGI